MICSWLICDLSQGVKYHGVIIVVFALYIDTIIQHTVPSLPDISDSILWVERDSARVKCPPKKQWLLKLETVPANN